MANGGDASYCFDASVFQPHVSLQHGAKQGAGTAAGNPSAAAPFDAPAFVQSMMVTHGVPLAELRADLSRFVTSVKTEVSPRACMHCCLVLDGGSRGELTRVAVWQRAAAFVVGVSSCALLTGITRTLCDFRPRWKASTHPFTRWHPH